MDKDFINKEVEILVSFARGYHNAGSVPVIYRGLLLDSNELYLKLDVNYSEIPSANVFGKYSISGCDGLYVFKKEYVIYVRKL